MCVFMFTYPHTHVYMYIHIWSLIIYIYIYIYMHRYMYILLHIWSIWSMGYGIMDFLAVQATVIFFLLNHGSCPSGAITRSQIPVKITVIRLDLWMRAPFFGPAGGLLQPLVVMSSGWFNWGDIFGGSPFDKLVQRETQIIKQHTCSCALPFCLGGGRGKHVLLLSLFFFGGGGCTRNLTHTQLAAFFSHPFPGL